MRFSDPDTQLKAKDALQARLGDNYIVALNLLSASPPWLTAIGALPMYLGLDLRGGVHFLLQVDMKAALDKAADRYTTDIRSLLREKKVVYAGVAREGTNVVVRFREAADRNKARTDIELAFPDLILRDADAPGGELRLVAGLKPEAQKKIQDGAVTGPLAFSAPARASGRRLAGPRKHAGWPSDRRSPWLSRRGVRRQADARWRGRPYA